MADLDTAERILNQQEDEQPIVVDEDGHIHPASDGSKGASIQDNKGDA